MQLAPVTIVVPVHDDAPTLLACVRAVHELTEHPDWRLLIVDDGSTDGGPAALRAAFPDIEILPLAARGGVARALNAGFSHPLAAGRDVVRLHADVVIETPDWLRVLATTAARHEAAIVGARLVYPDGRIQSEGRSLVTGLGLHPRLTDLRAFLAAGSAGPAAEVDAVPGALAYYSRAALDAVGGLDESYGPVWFEDDDFCIAARHRGFRVFVQPAVFAVHYTRCAGPAFQAKVVGSEKILGQVTHQLKQTALQVQSAQWEAKWGWNPLYPDTNEIRRLHGHTAVTWRIGEPLRYRPASEFPAVDCALVTWNSLAFLKRTLETLALTDYPADRLRVYVADNGSTDGTPAYLRELAAAYPFPLHVVSLPLNTGVAAGINAAILAGSAELVARLDDDIALTPGWLKVFVEDLRNRPFAGCVATKTVNDTPARTLQWACPHSYPNGYNYRDEIDAGQADYLARVAAIHGCCILYRRDTFKRCGGFDIRYSPTQYDDIDHNFTLVHAGYEVLYDGRTHVVHKISTGLDRSFAGMASASANGSKMYGKWGHDVFERIDTSITLSREGRYLPDDGDTSAWLAAGPSPEDFPRCGRVLTSGHLQILDDIYGQLAPQDGPENVLLDIGRASLKRVRQLAAKGFHMDALDVALAAANFLPAHPEVYVALSSCYHRLGYLDQARAAARRGLHLAPDHAALRELASRPALLRSETTGPSRSSAAHLGSGTAEPFRAALRVLMVNAFQPRLPDDDLPLMLRLASALADEGVRVEFAQTARPDPRGFDLVHVWNTAFPFQTLSQLNAIRVAAPGIPVCLTTLYADPREAVWAASALGALFPNGSADTQTETRLRSFARGLNPASGEPRPAPRSVHLARKPAEAAQARLLALVDHLLPASGAELTNLRRELGASAAHTLLPFAIDTARLLAATPDWFHARHPARDFVLCVAEIAPQKNQLLLLQALRGTGLPLVLVGHHRNSDYVELCQRNATAETTFIEHLEPEELASVYRAARVHVLPSFQDCRFQTSVEAAIAGCSLVAARRAAEQEYFGDAAVYCDPADVVSIRNAVITALRAHPLVAERRRTLSAQLAERCDPASVARRLHETYRGLRRNVSSPTEAAAA